MFFYAPLGSIMLAFSREGDHTLMSNISAPRTIKISRNLKIEELITIFNSLFADSFNTYLEGGADEPLYLPAGSSCERNRLIFRQDHISSALHEIAHWCLAGEKRRNLIDYGYWYHPDGRSKTQQKIFETVEVRPQALEWIFSVAAAHQFTVSSDNLLGEVDTTGYFLRSVLEQVHVWCREPIPTRGHLFAKALSRFFKTQPFSSSLYRFS